MKIDRMIGILSILLQSDKVTAPYLAEKFEVSRRTINRDIEALCMAGIPLVTTRGADGGISIMEDYKIDRTLLTSSDMQAILAGLRSLDSVSGTNRYAQLMEKLSAGASNPLTGNQHILIDLSSWYKSSLTPKIELILSAIENCEKIEFTYYAPKGETHRAVEPYYLIFNWSSWYVWGWCLMRNELRMFKLNRMTRMKTKESFEKRFVPVPEISPERIYPYEYQVKAIFEPEYKWRLIDEFGAESFEEQPNGKLLFSFGFTDRTSIIAWILTFENGVELLEPEWIRNELLAFGKHLIKKYGDT